MGRLWTWLGALLVVLISLAVLPFLLFYAVGEWQWQQRSGRVSASEMPPLPSIAARMDSSTVALGRRRARTLQCTECHGAALRGKERDYGRVPSLIAARREYSDAELARAIRYGIGADSMRLHPNMPSMTSFYHLSDRDVEALVAYIRSRPSPPAGNSARRAYTPPTPGFGIKLTMGRARIMTDFTPPPIQGRTDLPRHAAVPSDGAVAYGRYLTLTHCARCHMSDLSGGHPYWQAPDVAVGAAYSPIQFKQLLRSGRALGDREIGFMTVVAQKNLRFLTDAEIEAIHTYVKTRSPEPQ